MELMVRMYKMVKKLKNMCRKEKKTRMLKHSYKMEIIAPERKKRKPTQTVIKDKYVFSSIFPNAEVMQRVYKILQENSE